MPSTVAAAEAGAPIPPVGERLPPDLTIWRNRNFLLLWLAQAISQTAQHAIWYGIVVLVQQRSNSSTLLSVAVLTLIVPSVIFGVVAGVYVDRWDKRTVLVWSNVLRGGVAFAYTAFGLVAGLPLWLLFGVNFVFSTFGQFFAPAEAAMIPALVARRRLMQANGLFHLTFTASQLGGLVLMGPLVAKIGGVEVLFLVMAVAIVVCGGLVVPLPSHRGVHDPKVPRSGGEAFRGVWSDVQVVWRFLRGHRVVALAMVQWTVGAILGLVVATLVPGFAERLLRVRAEDAVFVMAPAGVGTVLGTALLNRWGDRFEKHFLANTGLLVVGVAIGAIGLLAFGLERLSVGRPPLVEVPTLGLVSALVPVVMGLALVAGLAFVAVIVTTQTQIQERAPVELRGRVFAVQLMLSNVSSIIPLLALGGLADLIGVDVTLVLVGALVGVVWVVSLLIAPGVPPWKQLRP